MKRGFTLIELLAVIVILAIIALIAVPIVLNIINDSKESSLLRSAEFYLDAVEYTIADAFLYHGGLSDGEYPITLEGNICKVNESTCTEANTLKVEVNGEKPTGGSLIIENGNISVVRIEINNQIIVNNTENEVVYADCVALKGNGTSVGDEIMCAGENFYVINNNGSEIEMLSKYNLNVGNIVSVDVNDEFIYKKIISPLGLQKEEARGLISFEFDRYGVIEFSENDYWYDFENSSLLVDTNYVSEGRTHPYIYNESSTLYSYLKSYEDYLKSCGITSVTASLLSYEQANDLGCTEHECISAPSWTYSTSYWLGSAFHGSTVYFIDTFGNLQTSFQGANSGMGIRPVITISKDEIKS